MLSIKEFVKDFKVLTGYSMGDIARKLGVSRQFIHQAINNHSLTYKASVAFYMTSMINVKISLLKKQIRALEFLQSSIEESVILTKISEVVVEDENR